MRSSVLKQTLISLTNNTRKGRRGAGFIRSARLDKTEKERGIEEIYRARGCELGEFSAEGLKMTPLSSRRLSIWIEQLDKRRTIFMIFDTGELFRF
jgi:hypothetical protein